MPLLFENLATVVRGQAVGLGLAMAVVPALAQGPAALQLTPVKPTAGQPVTLHYHPTGTELAGKPVGTVKVYYWAGTNRPPNSKVVPATGSPDEWQATLALPADTKAFVVQLLSDGADDKQVSQRYVFPVYAGSQPVAGALGMEAILYGRGLGVPEDPKQALALLRKELAQHPANKAQFSDTYYQLLAASQVAADQAELSRALLRLRQSPREQDRITAINVYSFQNKAAAADALLASTRKAFPKGSLARNTYLDGIAEEKDPARQQAKYEAFLRAFPENQASRDDQLVYDYARLTLAMTYTEAGQVNQALNYVSLVRNPDFRPTAYRSLAQQLLKGGHLAEAQALLQKVIAGYQADLAAGDNTRENDYYPCLVLYSQVLYQQQQYPGALTSARQAYEHSNKHDTTINEAYALALAANQQGAAALPLFEELLKTGQASAVIRKALPATYAQAKGSPAGYEAYLAGLKSALSAHIRDGLAKQLVSKAAPDFTLKDLQGNSVTLSALRGKVVVLDFWATWCGPCQKSFPAMQQAVEKYKSNPNVVFLFIDTWERVANPQQNTAKFIADNKYPFQVLLDLQDPATKKTAVVASYGISGIPSKFVIDPKGLIRFELAGFSGGDDAAVEEISAMIELAAGKG